MYLQVDNVIESELYSIFLSISPIFPAVLHPLFSLLPVMVRLFPYLVPERNQRTFAARANNGHCDLSLHVILNIVDKLVYPVKVLLRWPKAF